MDETIKNKPRREQRNLKKMAGPLIILLGGGALGFVLGSLLNGGENTDNVEEKLPLIWLVFFMVLLVCNAIFVIGMHELGHVIGGLLAKFEFKSWTVAIFTLYKEDGRLKFRWNFDMNTFGGLALCLPRSEERLLKRFAWYAAAGPVASLLLAMLAFTGHLLVPEPEKAAAPLAWALHQQLILTTIVSAAIFITTVIPARAGGFYTDGARVLRLLRGGPRAEMDTIMLMTISRSSAGVRAGELNRELLEKALELDPASVFVPYVHNYLYYLHIDRGNTQQAALHLEACAQLSDRVPSAYQDVIWLEMAWFQATVAGNAEKATEYLQQARATKLVPADMVQRAKAAVALARGKYTEAIDLAEEGLKQLHKNIDKGNAKASEEWLREIIARAHKSMQNTQAAT